MFTPVDNLVTLESQLSAAEERGAIAEKQRLENELVYALEEFVNLLYPDKSESPAPAGYCDRYGKLLCNFCKYVPTFGGLVLCCIEAVW